MILDAFALLAYLQQEQGFLQVEQVLSTALYFGLMPLQHLALRLRRLMATVLLMVFS